MANIPRLPARVQRVPWQVVLTLGLQIAREGRQRWDRLSQREQRELTRIVRKSGGRPGNLSAGERAELRRIVWKALGPER
jgi:hypothetical protein